MIHSGDPHCARLRHENDRSFDYRTSSRSCSKYHLRKLAALASVWLLASCTNAAQSVRIKMGETEYHLPKSHLLANRASPNRFVRISAPERPFDLIYDSRHRPVGRDGIPLLFSVSEHSSNADRHFVGGLTVLRRRASAPNDSCAFELPHGGVRWTVLFPSAHFGRTHEIREDALAALEQYRRGADV